MSLAATSRSLPVLLLFGCTDSPNSDGVEPGQGPESLCQVHVECGGSILDDPKAPCKMQIFSGDGSLQYDGAAGLEKRGRSSLYFPKPQYAVELRQHTELPVWPGANWKYLDDGSTPPSNWSQLAYDDTPWANGPAPLGFGQDYLQTNVSPGSGSSVTTYFRHEFTLGSRASITKLDLGLQRHGGVAVYLNGVEIARDNLADGADSDTPALEELTLDEAYSWQQIELDPALLVDGTNLLAVELHRASRNAPGMRFNLWLEATGEDAPTDLFGMGEEADWILNGQYVDRALFRNRLAYDLFQSFGGKDRYATETVFCELELGGEYQGIYTLGEQIKRDDNRVILEKGSFDGESFLIKLDDEPGFHPSAVAFGNWQLEYPDPSPEAEAAVSAYLTGWEEAILGSDPADPETGIFAWLDLDSAVDWVILNEFMKNNDAYYLSVHLWKDVDGKMHFVPWDLDLSMGYPNTDCGAEGWLPRRVMGWNDEMMDVDFIQKMAEVPAFRQALSTRWQQLRTELMSEETLLSLIEGYDKTLAPGIDANFQRWPMEEIVFSTPNHDNWLCPVSSYEEEHARVLSFITERLAWMDDNIDNY